MYIITSLNFCSAKQKKSVNHFYCLPEIFLSKNKRDFLHELLCYCVFQQYEALALCEPALSPSLVGETGIKKTFNPLLLMSNI